MSISGMYGSLSGYVQFEIFVKIKAALSQAALFQRLTLALIL